MIEFFSNEVYCGRMSIEDVPECYLDDVRKMLTALAAYDDVIDPISEGEPVSNKPDVDEKISALENSVSELKDTIEAESTKEPASVLEVKERVDDLEDFVAALTESVYSLSASIASIAGGNEE